MNRHLILFLLLTGAAVCRGQETNPSSRPDTIKVYEYRDTSLLQKPSFPGGESELMNYLMQHVKYPATALKKKISGIVPVSFVVNETGEISDIKVLRDIGGGCGEESVRVVQNMPVWIPGKIEGQPVKVRFTLPIRFKIKR